jgi:peptide deformylase
MSQPEAQSGDATEGALSLIPREDSRLARASDAVIDFSDPAFQRFIEELIACGEDNMGVGIAAPQVGRNIRLFIMAPKPGPRYPDSPQIEPFAVLNPEILRLYGEVQKGWEGCLSVPGYRGLVPRYEFVDATWLDRHGNRQEATFGGFLARIFQHEFDHLEGVLYPSRMDPADPLLTLEEFAAKTGAPQPPR